MLYFINYFCRKGFFMLKRRYSSGFSLMELLIVIAVIAFLSALAVPSLFKFLAKSKRSEAYMTLRSLAMAEKAYWLEHGSYTTNLSGSNGLGWKPEGMLQYTYGFPGGEGAQCFIGALKAPGSALQGAGVKDNGFTIMAAGDIDGDGQIDLISIDQNGTITVVNDDLK
jgi:prepilin-type N-terminal cleavage/methylation domain-containing protein